MRPGQNKRMRGRTRRGPNPLTRSFESNGPDVKVRGTAQHIAEKYTQLARDAHLAGDPVAAESYLQHAEHYFRIIAAAFQAQQAAQNGTVDERDDDDDEDFDTTADRFTFRTPQTIHQAQQGGQNDRSGGEFTDGGEERIEGEEPNGERQPEPRQHESRGQEPRQHEPRQHRNHRDDRRNGRPDRGQDRGFRPRNDQNDRFGNDRSGGDRFSQDRFQQDRPSQDRLPQDRPPQDRFNNDRPRRPQPEAEPGAEQPGLPAFLTAPVRPIAVETVAQPVEVSSEAEGGAGEFRARRRRGRPPGGKVVVDNVGGGEPA